MKLGYARVSTDEQNMALQIDALREAGAERIFTDQGVSGSRVLKPAYSEMLRMARPGDEIIVWRLDRVSRSLVTLIADMQMLEGLGLSFRSLKEQIETTTPAGKLYFHIVGAFAQFERDVIRERTEAGLVAARRAGKRLGRPPSISPDQWEQAKELMAAPHSRSVSQVATLLNVSRQAIYKKLDADKKAEAEIA